MGTRVLQARMTDEPCAITDDDIKNVLDRVVRMGMDIDGFQTVFSDNIPRSFLFGLRCFESVARSGEIRIIDLTGPDPELFSDDDGAGDEEDFDNQNMP